VKYNALKELVLARTREFYREPEAVFWVYVFPVLLMGGLGVAFRGGGGEETNVDIVAGSGADRLAKLLEDKKSFHAALVPEDEARRRYAAGKADIIVRDDGEALRYTFDPSRSGAEAVKVRLNDALQAAEGRKEARATRDELITEPGQRYIDWLIPGILGMNIMGGGMWGLGFVTVDFRMRKLLKRFVATPMRKSDFLLALMASRMLFLVPEMIAILAVGHWVFGLQIRGSLWSVAVASLVGAVAFAGIGLLIACRTDKIETVSGLMNLIMLPMWLVSGIFFRAERFPDVMQPFVQALPLTQLNNTLRKLILEGSPLAAEWLPLLALAAYGVVAFGLALRWFKWQ
jgi:ABC-2 type transport system permease protein